MFYSLSDYFSTLQVENPNGAYSGQKLMRLVNTKTPAKTRRIIPKVPLTVFVKYNTAKIAATINRTIRSALPMFFFITNFLLVNNLNKNNKNGNDEYTRKADSNKFVNWLPFFHLHIKIR
jgi:hypothetical protein